MNYRPTAQASKKPARQISMEMLLKSTSLTRSSKESHEEYLARVTHLHLQGKRIGSIENLEMCTNLKVLYLYENQIEAIENLDFATILQYLYLQNNFIKEIPHLKITSLRKIYLDENDIKVVTGLEMCENLEELHVARQRLPSFSTLQFDPQTLATLSQSLQVLEISGNGVSNLSQFAQLDKLRKFICKDNAVVDMAEISLIVSLPYLEEANFKGNPCCSIARYRDIAIGSSTESFTMLDEVPVPKHQQVAIKGLMAHRLRIGAVSKFQPQQSTTGSDHYQPQELGSLEEGSLEFHR